MVHAFLDANVLFSAAYREKNGLLRLWKLAGVGLITSAYAIEEARRNLESADARSRLDELVAKVRVVSEARPLVLPRDIRLAEKDRPILASAIACRADCLLTGDARDFGRFFGKRVGGVLVQTPGEFLRGR